MKRIVSNEKGTATMVAVFALMVLLTLGVAFLSTSISAVRTSRREHLRTRAMFVAEAGVERAISFLRGTAPDGSTNGSWRTHASENPDDHSGDNWYTESIGTGESFKVCVRSVKGTDTTRIFITSIGTVMDGSFTDTATVKVMVKRVAENVNCWNNVIFAGVGQAGHSINGNVVMRGSVHLLGDGEPFTDIDGDGRWDDNEPYLDKNANGQYDLGEPFTDVDHDGHRDAREPWQDVNGNGFRDPALTVTDLAEEMSGTADIGNNYAGMSAGLLAKIPTLPTVSFGGQDVGSLSSKLRVKHGQVSISGTATAGSSDDTTNSMKETLDGCYVTDGYTGNKGAASVYSDNGSTVDYDLGDGKVTFPSLLDPQPPYATYKDYLLDHAYIRSGDLTVGPTDFSFGDGKGSASYNAATKTLQLSGIVCVTGNLFFTTDVKYRGNGTIFALGNIAIEGNLVPETKFPTTDVIGLISGQNMTVGSTAQLTVAAALYAQYQIYIPKQTEVAGTCVSSFFNVKNVPHLYQVPALKDHLPPGMPGSEPIWVITISIQSWQDVGGTGS